MKKITRQRAIAEGKNKYFTGKPCKHGHISAYYIRGGCVTCATKYSVVRQRKNGWHFTTWVKDHREEWNAYMLNRQRNWTQEQRDDWNAYSREYMRNRRATIRREKKRQEQE